MDSSIHGGRKPGAPADRLTAVQARADQGDAGGQHDLGLACHRASLDPLHVGREESRIEAYKWLHLAAEAGYRGSTAAWELVTMSMTRAEIAEGNRRAAAFVARPPANPQEP